MRSKRVLVSAVGVAAAITVWVVAAQQPAAAPSAEETAVRAAAQDFAKAFAAGDAKAFAGLWTENAEYIDEDNPPVRGKAAIEKAYADFFAKRKEVSVDHKTDSVRILGKDAAVEEGTFTVKLRTARRMRADTPHSLFAKMANGWSPCFASGPTKTRTAQTCRTWPGWLVCGRRTAPSTPPAPPTNGPTTKPSSAANMR